MHVRVLTNSELQAEKILDLWYASGFQLLSHPDVLSGAMAHCHCNDLQLCNCRLAMVAPSGADVKWKAGTQGMAYHWCDAESVAELGEAA